MAGHERTKSARASATIHRFDVRSSELDIHKNPDRERCKARAIKCWEAELPPSSEKKKFMLLLRSPFCGLESYWGIIFRRALVLGESGENCVFSSAHLWTRRDANEQVRSSNGWLERRSHFRRRNEPEVGRWKIPFDADAKRDSFNSGEIVNIALCLFTYRQRVVQC